jgi:hypothetical protein
MTLAGSYETSRDRPAESEFIAMSNKQPIVRRGATSTPAGSKTPVAPGTNFVPPTSGGTVPQPTGWTAQRLSQKPKGGK